MIPIRTFVRIPNAAIALRSPTGCAQVEPCVRTEYRHIIRSRTWVRLRPDMTDRLTYFQHGLENVRGITLLQDLPPMRLEAICPRTTQSGAGESHVKHGAPKMPFCFQVANVHRHELPPGTDSRPSLGIERRLSTQKGSTTTAAHQSHPARGPIPLHNHGPWQAAVSLV